jgi:hypothetical protein
MLAAWLGAPPSSAGSLVSQRPHLRAAEALPIRFLIQLLLVPLPARLADLIDAAVHSLVVVALRAAGHIVGLAPFAAPHIWISQFGSHLRSAFVAAVVHLAAEGIGFALDADDGGTVRMLVAHRAFRNAMGGAGQRCDRSSYIGHLFFSAGTSP